MRRAPHVGHGACPVEFESDSWVVRGHPEVVAAAEDPARFSSAVSTRRVIPNGLDGAEHTAYREATDPFLTTERVAQLEPQAREIAAGIVEALPRGSTVRTIGQIGTPFAVRVQSTWLGWPQSLEPELVAWMQRNRDASRAQDRTLMAEVAEEFDHIIRGLIAQRRDAPVTDVTGELMQTTVHGRPLEREELVSILRNWTAGDLGSLASSAGVIVQFLAVRPDVQRHIRELVAAGRPHDLEAAIEEMLRIDDPFVANRRITTEPVALGEEQLPAGALAHLNWAAANRDHRVFPDPDRYDPDAHAADNLVFGRGPHVCPGRALTLMELRVLTAELVAGTEWIEPAGDRPFVREDPPGGGWARVPVKLR